MCIPGIGWEVWLLGVNGKMLVEGEDFGGEVRWVGVHVPCEGKELKFGW